MMFSSTKRAVMMFSSTKEHGHCKIGPMRVDNNTLKSAINGSLIKI
jgi:hypothetical protein